jgi:hypothetical protein
VFLPALTTFIYHQTFSYERRRNGSKTKEAYHGNFRQDQARDLRGSGECGASSSERRGIARFAISAAPASPSATTAAAPSPSTAPAAVDVTAILDQAVAIRGQKLDWRHSIVDLMKALKMDTTLAERRELAAELHYTGDTQDTATMNIWLHKALMKRLADNGGKVPADLTD